MEEIKIFELSLLGKRTDNMLILVLIISLVPIYLKNAAYSLPATACFAPFNPRNCGKEPTPVMHYYRPGSRCERRYWRGCFPNPNMFRTELECMSACIYSVRAKPNDYHKINELPDGFDYYEEGDVNTESEDMVTENDINTNKTIESDDSKTPGEDSNSNGSDVSATTVQGGDQKGDNKGGSDDSKTENNQAGDNKTDNNANGEKKKSGEACAAKEDCVPGAECTNTKCECVAATHVAQVDNTCKLKAGSSEKCGTKDDCTAGAKCDADKCVCETAEDTDKPGTCKASAADANPGAIKLGATCTATAECSGIAGAICSGADAAKTCACNMYTHKEDGGSCKAYLTTGETCKPADTDCGPGGQCTEPAGTEVCSCKETHVAQAADKSCKIRPEQAAVPCTADEECTADATCDATAPRQCKCKAGKKADAATGTCIDE